MPEFINLLSASYKSPRQGNVNQVDIRTKLPVNGYERTFGITPDGIVQEGGGKIYYTNSAGEFAPVLMKDTYDTLQNVIRIKPAERVRDITTVGIIIAIPNPGPTGDPT